MLVQALTLRQPSHVAHPSSHVVCLCSGLVVGHPLLAVLQCFSLLGVDAVLALARVLHAISERCGEDAISTDARLVD